MGDVEVDDFVLRMFLRYYAGSARVDVERPRTRLSADLELLRFYWALGSRVRAMVQYIERNRHEIQAMLSFREGTDDARIKGRIDARASVLRRERTGHPTTVVVRDAVRSYASGPNHVLCWTIEQCWRLVSRFEPMLPVMSLHRERCQQVAEAVSLVRRMQPISSASQEVSVSRRPSAASLREATRSRVPVYRHAAAAYLELLELEHGTEDVLRRIVNEAVLGPLMGWERYELAVGLAIAEALSSVTGVEATLSPMGEGGTPLASVGSLSLWWQTRTGLYRQPVPEPSEVLLRGILQAYGLHGQWDRPDLVLVNEGAGKALAVIEVKYTAGDISESAMVVSGAAEQVVRYARGYATDGELNELLGHSMVALRRGTSLYVQTEEPGIPWLLHFEALRSEPVVDWATTVVAADSKGLAA